MVSTLTKQPGVVTATLDGTGGGATRLPLMVQGLVRPPSVVLLWWPATPLGMVEHPCDEVFSFILGVQEKNKNRFFEKILFHS
jgi:hypothetical protein